MTPPSTYPDVIHKYVLALDDVVIQLPVNAQILHVHVQDNVPRLWVRETTDPAVPREPRRFLTMGTGEQFPAALNYIGTYFAGPYVWHVLAGTA